MKDWILDGLNLTSYGTYVGVIPHAKQPISSCGSARTLKQRKLSMVVLLKHPPGQDLNTLLKGSGKHTLEERLADGTKRVITCEIINQTWCKTSNWSVCDLELLCYYCGWYESIPAVYSVLLNETEQVISFINPCTTESKVEEVTLVGNISSFALLNPANGQGLRFEHISQGSHSLKFDLTAGTVTLKDTTLALENKSELRIAPGVNIFRFTCVQKPSARLQLAYEVQ